MSNITIGPPGSGALPTASTIDPVNDFIPIYTASASATQAINRNTYLGLGSAPVGLTDSQTISNKTLTSPTMSGPTLSGTVSGTYTIGGTPTFPVSVVTLTGIQTLTNKTLTSPTINSPTITNATLSTDTITGFTTSNSGTIYGIAITTGQITGTSTIASGALATNAVAAANLATNAIVLGTSALTSDFTPATTANTWYAVTGLSNTVTIPSGGRKIRITCYAQVSANVADNNIQIGIWDGTVGSGTLIGVGYFGIQSGTVDVNVIQTALAVAVVTPSAGSKTYNVGVTFSAASTTVHIRGFASYNASTLIVEAI